MLAFSIGWCPTNRNISPMVFFTNKIYSLYYRCFKTLRFRNLIPPSPIQILYKVVPCYACAKGVFLSFSSSTFLYRLVSHQPKYFANGVLHQQNLFSVLSLFQDVAVSKFYTTIIHPNSL